MLIVCKTPLNQLVKEGFRGALQEVIYQLFSSKMCKNPRDSAGALFSHRGALFINPVKKSSAAIYLSSSPFSQILSK